MLVQQRLFDMSSESGEHHVSEREALKASQDEKNINAARAPNKRRNRPGRKLFDSAWKKIIFFAQFCAGLSKIIGTFGLIGNAGWSQNLMWIAVPMVAATIGIVLVARNPLLLRKLCRVAISVIEKGKGMI